MWLGRLWGQQRLSEALEPCTEQLAEAGGPWRKGLKGLHRPQGAQSIAARGHAAAVGALPSLPALAASLHLTLELRHPWDPEGHHHLVCKIFGVAEQFTAGGKELRAEPSWRWQRTGRPAQALRSRLDGQADGPGGRAMSHGCREGASAQMVGMDQPAATATPRSVIRTPSLSPPSAWRLAGPGRRVGAGRCRLPELPLFAFNQDVSGRIKSTNWGNHHHKKSCACKIGQVRLQRERASDLHCKEEWQQL